jgi:hypothetical protein
VTVSASIAVTAPAPSPTAAAPAPVVPGTDPDEEAAREPFRAVIPVRGTGVRVIVVIAPIAYRGTIGYRSGNDRRTDAHADGDLRRGHCGKRQSQKCCYQNQAHTPHKNLLVLSWPIDCGPWKRSELRRQHLPTVSLFRLVSVPSDSNSRV